MKFKIKISLIVLLFMFLAGSAMADDLEGFIESVDQSSQSFVVQGITFYTTPLTDYDDGLSSFYRFSAWPESRSRL